MQILTRPYSNTYQGLQIRSVSDEAGFIHRAGAAAPRGNDAPALDQASRNPVITDTANDSSSRSTENRTEDPTQRQSHLTQTDLRLISELKQIDRKVRRHEMAHLAAAGGLSLSGASFTFRRGPDGINYAVGGEVSIDTSPVPGDPQATLEKMQKVKTAALAPADPSAQDVKVASKAASLAAQASTELMVQRAEAQARTREQTAFGNSRIASDAYVRVRDLPEQPLHSFRLAV